jgi:hypothetical protein
MPRLRGACPNRMPRLRGVGRIPTNLFIIHLCAHFQLYFDLNSL